MVNSGVTLGDWLANLGRCRRCAWMGVCDECKVIIKGGVAQPYSDIPNHVEPQANSEDMVTMNDNGGES